jgi:hypothetical protein
MNLKEEQQMCVTISILETRNGNTRPLQRRGIMQLLSLSLSLLKEHLLFVGNNFVTANLHFNN